MKGYMRVSYERFLSVAKAHASTLSRAARPLIGEAACTYNSTFRQLVSGDVYPVWYVDAARTRLLPYNDREAQPIRIVELAGLQNLIQDKLSSWYKPELGPIREASFITLFCTGCERRVIIDGVHRALWVATHDGQEVPVRVTELSGAQWPAGTPDLNVICVCRA